MQKMMRWRVKTRTNDELRYEFVAQYAPQILKVGLAIPDPELHYDAATEAFRSELRAWLAANQPSQGEMRAELVSWGGADERRSGP